MLSSSEWYYICFVFLLCICLDSRDCCESWFLDSCVRLSDWSSILVSGNFIQILVLTVGFLCFTSRSAVFTNKNRFSICYIIYLTQLCRICWYMVIGYWSVCWSDIDPCVDHYVDAYVDSVGLIFLSFKLIWVIVFVGIWYSIWYHINFTNIYFVCFCLSVSVCVWFFPYLYFLGG